MTKKVERSRREAVATTRLRRLDKDGRRLELLHEYTKWHNNIYLTMGGGLTVLATNDQANWPLTVNRGLALFAAILMALAGICGGVIATSALEKSDIGEFMASRLGPWRCRGFTGRVWTHLEHLLFWLALGMLGLGLCLGQRNDTYFVTTTLSDDETRTIGLCSRVVAEAVKYWDPELNRKVITARPLLWWKAHESGTGTSSARACAMACASPPVASFAFACSQPTNIQLQRHAEGEARRKQGPNGSHH